MACSTPSPQTMKIESADSTWFSKLECPPSGCGESGSSTPSAIPFPQALIELAAEIEDPALAEAAREAAARWF